MQPIEFINKYKNVIIEACQDTRIFPSVKMAQLILETGFGKSIVGNNLFGIKATGKTTPFWSGNAITTNTQEELNGVTGTYNLKFRSYKTQVDSIKDHSYLITSLGRYKKALNAESPELQCEELQKAGYATDSNYSKKLINLINTYNLKQLDEKKK